MCRCESLIKIRFPLTVDNVSVSHRLCVGNESRCARFSRGRDDRRSFTDNVCRPAGTHKSGKTSTGDSRHNNTAKRGGGALTLSLEEGLLTREDDSHVLAVEDALLRLEEISPPQAQIVEMRFFGRMTVSEVADEMGKSKRWVEAEWTMIRAWLRAELS